MLWNLQTLTWGSHSASSFQSNLPPSLSLLTTSTKPFSSSSPTGGEGKATFWKESSSRCGRGEWPWANSAQGGNLLRTGPGSQEIYFPHPFSSGFQNKRGPTFLKLIKGRNWESLWFKRSQETTYHLSSCHTIKVYVQRFLNNPLQKCFGCLVQLFTGTSQFIPLTNNVWGQGDNRGDDKSNKSLLSEIL